MSRVIKRFPYAADGYTVKNFNVGDEGDFGAATAALVAEGFIEDEDSKKKKTK